jgi:hypothetical protein
METWHKGLQGPALPLWPGTERLLDGKFITCAAFFMPSQDPASCGDSGHPGLAGLAHMVPAESPESDMALVSACTGDAPQSGCWPGSTGCLVFEQNYIDF